MSFGKIINGIKYIHLLDDNNLKYKSFEDNVYFTLRDITVNCEDENFCFIANDFINSLANYVCLQERSKNFKYSNSLNEIEYIKKIFIWLISIKIDDFKFNELNKYDKLNKCKYIAFNEWWKHFNELLNNIKNRYNELIIKNCNNLLSRL